MDSEKLIQFTTDKISFQLLDDAVMENPPTSWVQYKMSPPVDLSQVVVTNNYTVNMAASAIYETMADFNFQVEHAKVASEDMYALSGWQPSQWKAEANKSFLEQARITKANLPEVLHREDYIDKAEEVLWSGADFMEQQGYARGQDCDHEGKVCLRGAVTQAKRQGFPHLLPHHRLAIDLVGEYLELPENDHPVSWNDRTGRTLGDEVAKKEVVETMRLAYEKSLRDRGLL